MRQLLEMIINYLGHIENRYERIAFLEELRDEIEDIIREEESDG
jgi:hypothetical protein